MWVGCYHSYYFHLKETLFQRYYMIIPNYAPNEEAELVIPTQAYLIPRSMDLTTILIDD